MRSPIAFPLVVLFAILSFAPRSSADTSALRLASALGKLPDHGERFLSLSGTEGSTGPAAIVRIRSRADALRLGLIPIGETLAIAGSDPATWLSLASDPSVHGLRLAPARRPLLDFAGPRVGAPQAHQDAGLMGEGTTVGIVDTGLDAYHPSLRNVDGTTRVSWLLAFGRAPRGVHPEMEELYGCTGDDRCAIYSRDDIDRVLEGTSNETLPTDDIGHGTHVASIAAGSDSTYGGVAPLADLVIVAASDPAGGVTDARILIGTQFVFDRANENDHPAVVNISLGSSFGAHDGSSAIEEGLSELARGPGRAVVTAAGNDGGFVRVDTDDYTGPFGIHTEVAVPSTSEVRIPLLSSANHSRTTQGALFVWISTNPGDEISVGFSNGKGEESPLVKPGHSLATSSRAFDDDDDYDLTILNGVDDGLDAEVAPGNIVVALAGSWESGRVFELLLSGQGTARAWVAGVGEAGLAGGGPGPSFPRARVRGTVAVPASAPALVSVGASTNRDSWIDYTGEGIVVPHSPRGRANFSAAGPNQLGGLKPELVAPGAWVIGAMSQAADPRQAGNSFSIFSGIGTCPDDSQCYVIDDEHAVTTGTSMAAPLVTGAIALLMQRSPTLTMQEAKSLLMVGTLALTDAPSADLVGAGQLDIVASLVAQERLLANSTPPPAAHSSRVIWADNFVRPSKSEPLQGFVVLRDDEDLPTGGDVDDIEVLVEGPGHAEWSDGGAGLISLKIFAESGSGQQELKVTTQIDGAPVDRSVFTISIDPILAEEGFTLGGGTCAISPAVAPTGSSGIWWMLSLLLWATRRKRVG